MPPDGAPGVLYVVATPIGNLEDLSPRAARVLGTVSLVLAEDTRVTRKILSHLGVSPAVLSLHQHSPPGKVAALADRLAAGETMALVTDAGSPGVSDPGDALVAAAVAKGVAIVPIPGPSAVTTALMASGFAGGGHRFVGFLPRTPGRRRRALEGLSGESAAIVLFEAPDRTAALLAAARDALGADRRAVVCRELTKLHEQIVHGTLASLCDAPIPARGEVTVVIEGGHGGAAKIGEEAGEDVEDRVAALLAEGATVRDAADRVAAETGRARREIYRLALGLGRRRKGEP